MEILMATQNTHKIRELKTILSSHTVTTPADKGITVDVEETGGTFFDNAMIKAKHLYDKVSMPVLADDSGLCVKALAGDPGVASNRFGSGQAGRMLTDSEKNTLLLEHLEGIEDRCAWFVCSLVLVMDVHRFYCVQESMQGEIAASAWGKGGFGYDPVFYLPDYGCTVAQLEEAEKNKISHRAKAGKVMSMLLEKDNY